LGEPAQGSKNKHKRRRALDKRADSELFTVGSQGKAGKERKIRKGSGNLQMGLEGIRRGALLVLVQRGAGMNRDLSGKKKKENSCQKKRNE